MHMDNISVLADNIVKWLLNLGFIIQRYDAYSTSSVYLKLDYGVCNSIRISNHSGKRYLKYRYNIGPHIQVFRKEKDRYDRYYYQESKVDKMIKKICEDRESKLQQYGNERYQNFMNQNRCKHGGDRGFWRSAVLLNKK
jgi:hypothetical protein